MIVGTSSTSNTEFFVVIGMFIEAFETVLKDKRFQLSSRQATRARNLASSIVKWSKDPANHKSLAQMSGYMTTSLTSCMVRPPIVNFLFPVTRPHCNFRAACIFIITFDDHVIEILLFPSCC